ncbi:hypothetical protein A2115_02890 [Candidatus Woesebacteria bacterium GWA1_41_8]|uniref:LytR/CpsA/Psr regulator C-terminal domain-containing protein n=1 Tax=Candidatus Woesebacteria bacterium GWA1_41_8 TaxID=1802471 RepID=A0A1F7WHR8_9BACT|nr:MAG: hypothetical protein A2115_02890 [Candidatus Woesebacteria bacterium GWA1_41_8]
MTPKSKTPKVEEVSSPSEETAQEKETKISGEKEKASEAAPVPSWRAEVVEEGAEEEKKEEEKTDEAPSAKESTADEKSEDNEEKVTDLTAETPSESTETPQVPESPWVEETSSPPQSDGTVTISLSKKLFWLFLFLIIAGLVVGGFFFYKSRVAEKSGGTAKTPSSTPAPQATATPTPSEEVKLDSLKVNILNGSGIPGEAGKVQDFLEEAGFKDFKTGNADNYNYTITEVSLKEGVPDAVFDAVKEALGEYNVVKQEGFLDKDSEFDVEIIVGAKSAAATPSPSQ